MRNFTIHTVAALMLTVASCKCNNEKAEEKAIELDSTQTAQSIIEEDSVMVFDNMNDPWIAENFKTRGFTWSGFKLLSFWVEDSAAKKPANITPDFFTRYASVLKWSPDSAYVLDIGSYGAVVVKDTTGKSVIAKGEPDTEVSLLYPKENTKTRLLFAGPSMHVINATWADTSQVAMLTTLDTASNGLKQDTILWMIDVKESFYRKYKWH